MSASRAWSAFAMQASRPVGGTRLLLNVDTGLVMLRPLPDVC